MDAEEAMETESFLDELKRQLDKELPPEEMNQMIYLMTDKLGYDFQHCDQPSDVVTFLENNMKRSKVISVMRHALAVMKFHGWSGSKSFSEWIDRYQTLHLHLEDENFVGRQRDIERMCEILNTELYLGVWIFGIGGLGKTTVAKEIGSRIIRHRCVDFLCVDLKQAGTISDMYRSILRQLNQSSHETDSDALQSKVRDVLLGDLKKDTWILLDNIEDIYNQNTGEIESFLVSLQDRSQNCKIKLLVTSRVSLVTPVTCIYQYKLEALDDESSLKFLRSSCKPAVLDNEQYRQAMECCGNIPLALVLLSNTISLLASRGATVFNFSSIAGNQEQVQECITYVFDKLNEEMMRRLILLTVFDRSKFQVTEVTEVLGIPREEAIWGLMQLCHCDMLQKEEVGKAESERDRSSYACYTYFFHELLLQFLQGKQSALPKEEVSRCENRFVQLMYERLMYYIDGYYCNSQACIQGVQDNAHSLRLFFKHLKPSLLATMTFSECEHMQRAAYLVFTTDIGKIQNIKNIQKMSTTLECRYYWDVQDIAYCIESGLWDDALLKISRIEKEHLESLATRSQRFLKADLLFQKGRLFRRKKEFSNAKDCLLSSEVLFDQERSKDPYIVSKHANVLNALGNVAYNLREYDKALDYHEQAVEVMKAIVGESAHREVAMFKFNIGTVALAKARQIKDSEYVSEDDEKRIQHLMELCLANMDESIEDDVQLGLNMTADFADRVQYRSDAHLENKNFKSALNDAEESLKIRKKVLTINTPKRMLSYYKIGRIYMKEREHLKPEMTEARCKLLTKAKEYFERVATFIQDGDLTRDSEGIEPFLLDYPRLARATCVPKYLAQVETLCSRVGAGEKIESSTESSRSSSEENLDTPSDDSDVSRRRKDSGMQMDVASEEAEDTGPAISGNDSSLSQKRKRSSDSD